MAKVDEIRYAELARFLEHLGYVCREQGNAHIWEHADFDRARLILPAYRPDELVWSANVGAARATLDLHGVLDRDEFDRWRLNLQASDSEPENGRGNAPPEVRKGADKSGGPPDRTRTDTLGRPKTGRKRTGRSGATPS
jgi:hypothetical protein